MTRPRSHTPRIEVDLHVEGARIRQFRPAVLAQLAGMAIEQGLDLVPRLLPVCGSAQSVAAARAVEAARGTTADALVETGREQQLLRERAESCGWRLAIDWPDMLAEPRAMTWLKQLRQCRDPRAMAALLQSALPGLSAARTDADLRLWAGERHCTAARMLAETLAVDGGVEGETLAAGELDERARNALQLPDFNPLAPSDTAAEVGPLAMRGATAAGGATLPPAGRRSAALLLDTCDIAVLLQERGLPERPAVAGASAWQESPRCGVGRAVTARGPVYHRVELDPAQRVRCWRALAPTDWHFAANGPVAAALGDSTDTRRARLLVAGFDPCVPCHITAATGD